MTKAKLVILRHGQTEYNRLALIAGQCDVPLTEEGKKQALEAGALLHGIRFNKAYSSPLKRAFNTAALALAASKMPLPLRIEKRPEIMEQDTGDFTGVNHKTDPAFLGFVQKYDARLPNGESGKDVTERVRKFFDEEVMPRLLRGENVLITAHSGILSAFDIVLGIEPEPTPVNDTWTDRKSHSNAAPIVYEYEDGVLKGIRPLGNSKPAGAKPRKNGGPI